MYTITKESLEDTLEQFQSIDNLMRNIAKQKESYYQVLIMELKRKYKSKSALKSLYDEKKKDYWTSYQSLKTQMMKKNKMLQANMLKL